MNTNAESWTAHEKNVYRFSAIGAGMRKCRCEGCRELIRTQWLLRRASPELKAHVWKLWERIEAAETSDAWRASIMQNNWPNAQEIMRGYGWTRQVVVDMAP